MDPSARNAQRKFCSISTFYWHRRWRRRCSRSCSGWMRRHWEGGSATHQSATPNDSRPRQPRRPQEVAATLSYAEARGYRPGILLLGGDRVLVCGGGSETAEILQLPRDDSDSKGVWTLLTQQFTHNFWSTYLVKFNHRVIVVGELFFLYATYLPKQRLLNMICLHLRPLRAVWRVYVNIYCRPSRKNSSISRWSVATFVSTTSLVLPFRMHQRRRSCGNPSHIYNSTILLRHVSIFKE